MSSISSLFGLLIVIIVIVLIVDRRNKQNQLNQESRPHLEWDDRTGRAYIEEDQAAGPYSGGYTNSVNSGGYTNNTYSRSYSNDAYGSGSYYNEGKEVNEAILAGEAALDSLRDAERKLQSARGWGMMDIMGGGLISGVLKHERVSEAKACIENAKYQLNRFRDELDDIRSLDSIHIDIGDFLTFADFFFDGFIADFMVQSRIADARRQVQDAIVRVEQILGSLKSMRR
jgi:hypothetical protein